MQPTSLDVPPLRVIIASEVPARRNRLATWLKSDGHGVVAVNDTAEAMNEILKRRFDVMLTDWNVDSTGATEFIRRVVKASPWIRVIALISGRATSAMKILPPEVTDFLPRSPSRPQVSLALHRLGELVRLQKRAVRPEADETGDAAAPEAPGLLPTAVTTLARCVAPTSSAVLIHGEKGTGKVRLARLIHNWSSRATGPLGVIDCQIRSVDQLEAHLFGIATDRADRPCDIGLVTRCDGGTLVLDEVGSVPISLQPALLRLIHDREYERQDDFRVRQADVRVIATTSADLHELVRTGRFRKDLHMTLGVAEIELPPLRQRARDIPALARSYLSSLARETPRPIMGFRDDVLKTLTSYHWPGNLRELRNIVERAVLLCKSDYIGLEHLPPNMLRESPDPRATLDPSRGRALHRERTGPAGSDEPVGAS